MKTVKIFFGFIAYLASFSLAASTGTEKPFTPIKKDFVENGVPFVADVSGEYNEDSLRTDGDATAADSSFTEEIDEDTPVTHEDIQNEKNLTASRSWKTPDFSKQENALGYGPQAFAIPKGMEIQVKFWIDIYSKYNSDQGVLHDSEYIDLIYEELDFSTVSSRTDLNAFQKEALKRKMVKDGKKRVISMLEKLSKTSSSDSLTAGEKKVWDYFQKINEPKKFFEASRKNRLRFQLGQKDRMIQGIYFSGRYIEDFEKIFRDAGLPIELVRLPFVESSYNVLARSKVGASGLWQIMPYTMKGFMKKDPSVDLRNHPIEATKLAAKLMRNNYNMLQSWPLALTGYNHGPSGVLRLTKKYNTRELGELVATVAGKPRFGFASRNFFASYLAALEVTSNAPKYLGTVTWSQTLDSVDLKLGQTVTYRDMVRWFDGDDLKTQIFNPHLTRAARGHGHQISKGLVVSVPKSKVEMVQKELESIANLKAARDADKAATPASEELATYKVKKGDTVQKIAKHFGVQVGEILEINKLPKVVELRVGQILKIP